MEGSQKPDPRGFEKGTEGQCAEGSLEVATENHVAPARWKHLEEKPPPMIRCWEFRADGVLVGVSGAA